ncbi:FAD-dependent oxidoreductase [Bradyrhizobium sp. 18BD]
MKTNDVEILVIGAGMAGLATAYYLAVEHRRSRLLIVDEGQPMALTSAQSGENYRNWWPHPTMAAFTDHSTDLMEDIARRTDNRIHMTRRGYLLVTRDNQPDELLRQLHAGYGASAAKLIRQHEGTSQSYSPPLSADWQTAPDGVDVLRGRDLIQRYYPAFGGRHRASHPPGRRHQRSAARPVHAGDDAPAGRAVPAGARGRHRQGRPLHG